MQPDLVFISTCIAVFFFGYFSRVVLRFFVRLASGSPEDL